MTFTGEESSRYRQIKMQENSKPFKNNLEFSRPPLLSKIIEMDFPKKFSLIASLHFPYAQLEGSCMKFPQTHSIQQGQTKKKTQNDFCSHANNYL